MNDLSRLPKVDRVLATEPLAAEPWEPQLKKLAVNEVLGEMRAAMRAGKTSETSEVGDAEAVARNAMTLLQAWTQPHPRRVLNATGVILHTNLGRAPLDAAATAAMSAAAGTCDLEVDLDSGKRGSRFVYLNPLLRALVRAEDVHVVNNGAAALLLACSALGAPGGVAISRGQMVEIGDGFRVADMAASGGTKLVEVGSTNRTHVADYEKALEGKLPGQRDQGVSALLWVHLSNFDQSGFVKGVELRSLAALAKAKDVPLIADLGSGSTGDGLPDAEPTIRAYLELGASLVTCSGDKLLGGPQAGIMAGTADEIHRCRRHPMARALRPDKTTLAALHATLAAHAKAGVPDLPVHRMVGATLEDLRGRAEEICGALGFDPGQIRETSATIGGGSLPGDTMPSIAIAVTRERPNQAARKLRTGAMPVVGRVLDDELIVDLRTVEPRDDFALIDALRAL